MAKSAREKAAPTSAKKGRRTKKAQVKAAEYVRHLLELHKLQGILLTKLDKELRGVSQSPNSAAQTEKPSAKHYHWRPMPDPPQTLEPAQT